MGNKKSSKYYSRLSKLSQLYSNTIPFLIYFAFLVIIGIGVSLAEDAVVTDNLIINTDDPPIINAHTASVNIEPEFARCDANLDFTVTIEHTSGDPIKEVRIYDGPFDGTMVIPPQILILSVVLSQMVIGY